MSDGRVFAFLSDTAKPFNKEVNMMKNTAKTTRNKGRHWLVPLSLLAGMPCGHALAMPDAFPDPVVHAVENQQIVSGVVRDVRTGETMPGVSIVIKGTGMGTQTDGDGRYSLRADVGQVLVATFLGYKPTEHVVSSAVGDFGMEPDETALDEVVVVGYGTMRKSDVTGSISIAKGEDMIKGQNFSALDNLRGKAAGVNIFSNSSQPGAYANRVVIRGTATINASSNPLYVVDGVVMEDFHLLNPNDIERIEVLKDASSAAIYGARGANGVVLVSTKRGTKDGRKMVGYQGSLGSSSAQRYMDVLNAQEWVQAFMTGLENENKWHGKAWSLDRKDWFNDPNYFDANGNPIYDTNWQREATRAALSHNHQLDIQQGDETSSVGTFLNYTDQQGIVNNTFSKRVNGKLAYDSKPKDWLSTSVNLTANHTWGRYTPEEGGGQDARRTMIEMIPWYPVYEPGSSAYTEASSSALNLGFEGMSNPVAILDKQKLMRYNTQIFGNAALTFHLADGLDLKTQIGVDNHKKTYREYSSTILDNISKPNGRAEIRNTDVLYWQEETYLTWKKTLDRHRINAMAGLSWQERTYNYERSRTVGFSDDFFEWNNLGVGTTPSAPVSDWDRWAMNSYFLRAAYSYNNRYSATLTGRYDGSSKFGKNNKYAFFPSMGLAWNLSNEDFLSGNALISNLKLHTSYGLTGNSEIGTYGSLANVASGTILMDGKREAYSYINTMANPDLKWEKTGTYDVGVELGLFANRLNFDVSYYHRKTTDLLLDAPLPNSTGFTTVMRNIGSVANRGVEIMLTATPLKRDDFAWSTTLNMNYNKNEVLKLGANDEDILQNNWVGGANSIIRVGENLNSFYGYRRNGVFTTQDFDNKIITNQNQIGRPNRSATKEILGKGMPDWTGSFINNFNYKQFDLLLDLQFVYGVETMQQFYHSTYDRFGLTNGLKEILYGAYDGTNPNAIQQAVVLATGTHAGQDSNVDSSWIADGSYLRFSTVQLGYTFGSDLARRMGFSSLRVYGSANNPWLITAKDFKGYDPEATSHGDGNKFGQNMVFFAYPRAKTFTFGVNLTL